VLDVTDHNAIKKWVNKTFSEDNSPDLLINNAGLAIFGDVDELTLDDWHKMINTNLNGAFYMTRQIIPLMKQSEQCNNIVNIVSIAGMVGGPKMTGYNASKFGLRGFSEALFKEVRHHNIKVTSFNPGSSATHFFDKIEGVQAHENMLQPPDVAKQLVNIIESPDNFLINEIVMRPLNPEPPEN